MDYFKWESGSKVWPSSDPKDLPVDKFTCKKCDWSFSAQVNGSFPIGTNPWNGVIRTIIEHMAVRHKVKIPLDTFQY